MMNAYELADELLRDNTQLTVKAAYMLRQQADRIDKLEREAVAKNNYLEQHCEKIDQQADRIAELEKGGEVAGRFYWESVVDGHVMAVPSEGTPHYNKDDFPLYTAPQCDGCGNCHTCLVGVMENNMPVTSQRMIVCSDCGNKRCPKASNHRHQCTGSNEPNQRGSIYTTPRELSDEEIMNIAFCSEVSTVAIENDWNGTVIEFARAILKKASEK